MKQNNLCFIIIIIIINLVALPKIAFGSKSNEAQDAMIDLNQGTHISELFKKYDYDPTGRRDPFKTIKINHELKIDLTSPLEKWDLEQFTVVGILWGGKEPRAMIKDPEGKLFTVSKKTKIGKNNGQIIKIREGEIVVLESAKYDGELRNETRTLEMKK